MSLMTDERLPVVCSVTQVHAAVTATSRKNSQRIFSALKQTNKDWPI